MEIKKKKNLLPIIIIIFFSVFLILYISKEAGYYDYKVHEKAIMTEEAIKKFENDIKEGKDVKSSDYLVYEYIDYSNKFTNAGYNIGNLIEKVMNKSLKKGVKIILKLFWQ